MIELLPYFVTTLLALVAIFGVLLWSGTVAFRRRTQADRVFLRGVFDNFEGARTAQECFAASNRVAYRGATFWEDLPVGANCQLYRSVFCASPAERAASVFDPRLGSLDDLKTPCAAPPSPAA